MSGNGAHASVTENQSIERAPVRIPAATLSTKSPKVSVGEPQSAGRGTSSTHGVRHRVSENSLTASARIVYA